MSVGAGIALPEGNPGAVEGAASRLTQAAGGFADAARTIRQAESGAGVWRGVAFFTFSDHCGQQSEAARAGSEACRRAAVALRRYAGELEDARERVRELQRRGQECVQRIDAAEARAAAAGLQESAAHHRGLQASLAGGPGAVASQAAAAQDAQDARNARNQALGEADAARGQLRRLQEQAEQERDHIKRKARATASVVRGAVGQLPAVQFPAAPAAAQLQWAGGGGSSWWNTTNEGMPWWNEDAFAAHLFPFHPANDELARYKWFAEQGGGFALSLSEGAMIGYAAAVRNRAIRDVPGLAFSYSRQFVAGRGGAVLVQSLVVRPTTTTVIDADLLARAGAWGKAGRALPVVGTVAGIGTAAWDQWRADTRNPNLTTTDRVGRSAGVGIYVGGAAAGGAAIGTMLFPGVGTLAGAGIGAAGGLVAGAVAVSIEPAREFAADAGEWTANAAVDTWNWGGDRLDDLGDAVSGIDLPDVPDVNVDLPDVDLPDVNPF